MLPCWPRWSCWALFVVIERRTTHPLLPLRVILDRNRAVRSSFRFLAGTAMLGMFLFLTYYFQGTLHYSALKSGFAFLPFSAGIIVGAGVASRVLPKVGPRRLMVGGFLAAAVGCAWLTQIGVRSSFVAHVLPAEIVMSIGLGMVFVPMSSTALIGVSPHDAGVASATLNMSQQVGGSLGTALLEHHLCHRGGRLRGRPWTGVRRQPPLPRSTATRWVSG